MKVGIIFGSMSDMEIMRKAYNVLTEFGVETESYALSAHRVPEELKERVIDMEERGFEVFIAGAGLAAHLPGVLASMTVKPVIGVPLKGALEGLDALLSIVQMPKRVPVATVGINNAENAGLLAVQILSLKYPELEDKLKASRLKMKKDILGENLGKVEFL